MLSFCAVVFQNKILCKAKIDNGEDECKSDQQKIRVQEICLYGHVSHFGASANFGHISSRTRPCFSRNTGIHTLSSIVQTTEGPVPVDIFPRKVYLTIRLKP